MWLSPWKYNDSRLGGQFSLGNTMIKMFVKSTGVIKLVLFLFLGLMLSLSVQSQNCQIIDSVIVRNVDCHGDATGFIDIV